METAKFLRRFYKKTNTVTYRALNNSAMSLCELVSEGRTGLGERHIKILKSLGFSLQITDIVREK